jgi:hypothetical protein
VDRYVNVGLAGLTYDMFGSFPGLAPFKVNVHVYSCILVSSTMPYVWRGRYNEDTDLCLQVISGGLCTVLVQVFTCEKIKTMTVAGGNTAELYKGHGRLAMARSLERVWPYVVKVVRQYGRPAHYVKWEKFTTALVPRPGFDPTKLPAIDEHGLELVQVKDTDDTGWS